MNNSKDRDSYYDKLISDYLVDELTECVSKKTVIPDEYLNAFLIRSIEVVRKEDTSEISSQFTRLSDAVSLYARGHKYEFSPLGFERKTRDNNHDRSERLFVFQMGELNACITMLNDVILKKNIKEAEENKRDYFEDNFEFFRIISQEPGIIHSELAARANKSKSALSNFVSKIKPFGYIIQTSLGRNKHYYLTGKGETILRDLSRKKYGLIPSTISNILANSSYYGAKPNTIATRFIWGEIETEMIINEKRFTTLSAFCNSLNIVCAHGNTSYSRYKYELLVKDDSEKDYCFVKEDAINDVSADTAEEKYEILNQLLFSIPSNLH